MTEIRYNPAIDGLRAIAVLAVVAYHAGLPVPAGFVGVDIFFVISGYLITRILRDELVGRGSIDLWHFYARRARRILPALVVVVVATLLAVRLLLPSVEQIDSAKAAAASLAFAGNIYFYAKGGGYFEGDSTGSPLLHLWSLGVEEQFYLLWPLLLLAIRNRAAAAVAVLAVVSLVTAELWLLREPDGPFYLMPTRAWELAAGALVALRPLRVPKWLVWPGLALVLGSCWLVPPHFPGLGALPSVAGAAIVLASLQAGAHCGFLSARPMAWTGLISYSLYLWHWPVLVIGKQVAPAIPPGLLVLSSVPLAILSYRYIEARFRRGRIHSPRRSVAVAAAASVAAMSIAVVVSATARDQGAPAAPKVVADAPPAPRTIRVPEIYQMGCDDWYQSDQVKLCGFATASATRTVVVIGDSVGLQWFPAVQRAFPRTEWKHVAVTKSACPMVDEPYFYPRLRRRYTECESWRTAALQQVAELKPDVVIIGSADTYPFSADEWQAGTERVLRQIASSAGAVRIMQATPRPSGILPKSELTAAALRRATHAFDNAAIVSMDDIICPERQCRSHLGGQQVFLDDLHLETEFAASLSDELRERLDVR